MSALVGAVILCRFDSTRLPGKILKPIGTKTILDLIMERVYSVFDKENVIIATSDESSDDPIYRHATEKGYRIFRGSKTNVAQRFLRATEAGGWDYGIRINGDNIFVDTKLLKAVKESCDGNVDFVSNVKDRTYPKGMSIESVRTDFMKDHLQNFQNDDFEHVTIYFYNNPDIGSRQYFYNREIPEAAGFQLALDTEEDFILVNQILEIMENHQNYKSLREIFPIVKGVSDEFQEK